MAASVESNIGLYYGWALGESGYNVQMDENLQAIGALLCLGVLSASIGTPPGSPATGARYLVPSTGTTGDWVGEENAIALWTGSVWMTFATKDGWSLIALDTGQHLVKSSGSWVPVVSLLTGYADDAAANTGGIAVGEAYVNSSTGAVTVRLV